MQESSRFFSFYFTMCMTKRLSLRSAHTESHRHQIAFWRFAALKLDFARLKWSLPSQKFAWLRTPQTQQQAICDLGAPSNLRIFRDGWKRVQVW